MTVGTTGQAISYTFSGSAGQTVSLVASNDTFPDYLVATVSQPNGTTIGTFYSSGSGAVAGSIILSNLPAGGTYTVRMVPSYINSGNGNFQPGGETGSVSVLLESEVAGSIPPNSSASIAMTLQSGQEAVYTFPATAGQFLNAGMNAVTTTSGGPLNMSITNPDGSNLSTFYVSNGSGSYFLLPRLTQSGNYTATITASGNDGASATVIFNGDVLSSLSLNTPAATVNVNEPGQAISYTFTGVAGQTVSLAVSGDTFPDNLQANVCQPNGSVIASSAFSNPYGNSGVIGTMMVNNLPVGGVYTVRLLPSYENSSGTSIPGGETGSVSLALEGEVTGAVPAGSNTATPLNLQAGQTATYTYSGVAGQFLDVGLGSVQLNPSGGYVNMTVLDPNGNNVTSFTVSDGSSYYQLMPMLTLTGTYTAVVANSQNRAVSASMTFNGDATGSLTLDGTASTSTVTEPGQAISLTFNGTAGQTASLVVSGNTFPDTLSATVDQPDGTVLATKPFNYTDGGSEAVGSMMLSNLPANGTYTVRLVPSHYDSGFHLIPGGETGSVSVTLESEVTGALSTSSNPTASFALNVGQVASYSFAGSAGQVLEVALPSISTTTSSGSVLVTVTQPDGSVLLSFNAYSGLPVFYPNPPTLAQTGTYLVTIAPNSNYGANATLDLSNDLVAAMTLAGPAIPLTLNVPGQAAEFTFSGTVSQSIILSLSGDTVPGTLIYNVYQPDGSLFTASSLNSDGTNPASGSITISNLAQTGTYTVRAIPSSFGGSNYQPDGAIGAVAASYANVLVSQTIDFPIIGNVNSGTVPVALNAVASSGLAVTYTSNTPNICTVTSNQATLIGSGNCSITASQPGNLNYSAAIPVTVVFNVSGRVGPSVTLNSPVAGQSASAPGSFTLSASASGNAAISQVQFFSGNALIGTATQAPYSISWSNVPPGTYSLTASAIDVNNDIGTSAPVAVTVASPVSVILTGPANGQTLQANTTISLAASVSDGVGSVTQVAYYSDRNLIGTATQAPYSFTIPNAAAGSYSLTAVATDSIGYTSTSAPLTFLVAASGFGNIGGVDTIHDIQTDQLNTPRLITDQSGNTVWQWDNTDPFGNNVPNQNPNGTSDQFVFNLRFPGQYYDVEAGTHYNSQRDYDPQTGRYVESDPLGLDGGQLSTYSYVGGNPIVRIDPNGLEICFYSLLRGRYCIGTPPPVDPDLPSSQPAPPSLPTLNPLPPLVSLCILNPVLCQMALATAASGKPPSDASDPNGAKAPGKPGKAEGFCEPKPGKPQWGRNPNGSGSGWIDANGNVWVPTGPDSGSTGDAHGGPHWDVQQPGGDYTNVYPGGKTR